MSDHKKETIKELVEKIKNYGFRVYVAESETYGFITDGDRVLSFEVRYLSLEFSGNYEPTIGCGTGWGFENPPSIKDISQDVLTLMLNTGAPQWAVRNKTPTYTTEKQHLKRYDGSSRYTLVNEADNE